MDFLIMDCGSDIKGESTIKDYKDKIELLSYSHGISMAITGDQSNQKRTAGKPNHQDFTVTKFIDLASCKLVHYCNTGKAIADVKIFVLQNEQEKVNPIITYEMKNVVVSSISESGGGGGKPMETVTLNYSDISWVYKPQKASVDASGQDNATWSLSTNSAS